MHIRMFQPVSVRQCLMLGRLYEKAHPKKPFQSGWTQGKSAFAGKGLLPIKKEPDGKPALITSPEKPREFQPQKFLTQEEMSKRRAAGLCYFCDEKYTPGHYMKHKKTQLFVMEVEEEEGLTPEEQEMIAEQNQEEIAQIRKCSHWNLRLS